MQALEIKHQFVFQKRKVEDFPEVHEEYADLGVLLALDQV